MGTDSMDPEVYLKSQTYEQFLESNLVELQMSIQVNDYYSWLRQGEAIDAQDQELIENKYYTTWTKAGALIDIIERRGEKGFRVFMAALERNNPETYRKVTGLEPRSERGKLVMNPEKPHQSLKVMENLWEVVNSVTQQITSSKMEIVKLNSLMAELQDELSKSIARNNTLQDRLGDMQNTCDQLQKERDEARFDCQRHLQERDKYMDELNDTKIKSNDAEQRWRSISLRTPDELRKLQQERLRLQMQLDQCRSKSQQGASDNSELLKEVASVTEKLAELEQTKGMLESQLSAAELDIKGYESRQKSYLSQIQELKSERDKIQQETDDKESMLKQKDKENIRLQNLLQRLNEEHMSDRLFRPRAAPMSPRRNLQLPHLDCAHLTSDERSSNRPNASSPETPGNAARHGAVFEQA